MSVASRIVSLFACSVPSEPKRDIGIGYTPRAKLLSNLVI